jgi:hypothetical protein
VSDGGSTVLGQLWELLWTGVWPVVGTGVGTRVGPGVGFGVGRDRIDVLNNRGASGRTNFAIDGILRGLTESFVARTTNLAVHYVVAVISAKA